MWQELAERIMGYDLYLIGSLVIFFVVLVFYMEKTLKLILYDMPVSPAQMGDEIKKNLGSDVQENDNLSIVLNFIKRSIKSNNFTKSIEYHEHAKEKLFFKSQTAAIGALLLICCGLLSAMHGIWDIYQARQILSGSQTEQLFNEAFSRSITVLALSVVLGALLWGAQFGLNALLSRVYQKLLMAQSLVELSFKDQNVVSVYKDASMNKEGAHEFVEEVLQPAG